MMCYKSVVYAVTIGLFLLLTPVSLLAEQQDIEKWSKYTRLAEAEENYAHAEETYLSAAEYYGANPKQLLRVYARLLKMYQKSGQSEKRKELIEFLRTSYPGDDFDVKDRVKFADILIAQGDIVYGSSIKNSIMNGELKQEFAKTYIRILDSMLGISAGDNDAESIASHIKKLKRLFELNLDGDDYYKISLLHLKYNNDSDIGPGYLKETIEKFPESKAARKALFVLAKHHQAGGDYQAAIELFNQYIRNYPEQEFFVQKSYQRIIDCLLALGNLSEADSQAFQLVDIVNGVKDIRSMFDLTENLYIRGHHSLAESTFLLAQAAALKRLAEPSISIYAKSLTQLHLIRAAYPLGQLVVAQREALLATTELSKFLSLPDEFTQEMDYLYSQLLLWRAKIQYDFNNYGDARTQLEEFISRYPKHKDLDYARYSLARILLRRWEVERLAPSNKAMRIETHNQTLHYVRLMGQMEKVDRLITAINSTPMKEEALKWVALIE